MWKAVEFDDAAKARIKQVGKHEKSLRLSAYLGASTDIGACRLRPLTARHVVELEYTENHIAIGGECDSSDIAHYCWLMRPDDEKRDQVTLVKDVTLASAKDHTLAQEIAKHFSMSFIDVPAGSKSDSNIVDSQVWLSPLVDCLASEYAWSMSEIMDTPLGVCFQLMQLIFKRRFGKKYSLQNPLTQKAMAQEMERLQNE